MSEKNIKRLANTALIALTTFCDSADIVNGIEEYKDYLDPSIFLAQAYMQIGDYDKALKVYEASAIPEDDWYKLGYYYVGGKIYDYEHKYKGASEAYLKYIMVNSDINEYMYQRKVQFIEERAQLESAAIMEKAEKHRTIFFCVIIGLLLSSVIVFIVLKNKQLKLTEAYMKQKSANIILQNEKQAMVVEQQKAQLQDINEQLQRAIEEYESLEQTLKDMQEKENPFLNLIRSRVNLLNSFLSEHLSDSKASKDNLQKEFDKLIKDQQTFMDDTRECFSNLYPKFINYLKEHALDTDEQNLVCLYAMGLRGKDISKYLNRPSHYNMSVIIRRKLGIEDNRNLGPSISTIFQKYCK